MEEEYIAQEYSITEEVPEEIEEEIKEEPATGTEEETVAGETLEVAEEQDAN